MERSPHSDPAPPMRPALARLDRRGIEMVLEITEALSDEADIHDVLGGVVRRVSGAVGVDRVSIVLRAASDPTAYVIASSDDPALRNLPIQVADYPEIVEVLESHKTLVVSNTSLHPLLSSTTASSRFRSTTLIPIASRGVTLGVLFLRSARSRVLSEGELFLLHALANATGIALRNVRLLDELRAQREALAEDHDRARIRLLALEQFADYFDSSADGILVIDARGEVRFCNAAACELVAIPRDELVGQSVATFLTHDGAASFDRVRRGFRRGVFPHNVDLPLRVGSAARVLSVSFNAIAGDHERVLISLRDVTTERRTARELMQTKEFLERVIESSVDAIVSADRGGKVVLFNRAAERISGYESADVLANVHVRDLYPAGVAEQIMALMRSGEQGDPGTVRGFETKLLGCDGQEVPVLMSAALIHHHGESVGSVGVFRDLRQRRHIEARLAATERELQAQERRALIAEIAGATAHELNQPLTAVVGYATLLARKLEEGSDLTRASEAIVREADRMAEIVRKIGRLTKYETKAYVGNAKIIDLDKSMDSDPPMDGR